jgi:hypothetical protein
MNRKIKQNIWGNWCGYRGNKRIHEFGTDEIAAAFWFLTGAVDANMGYAPEWFDKCKQTLKTI